MTTLNLDFPEFDINVNNQSFAHSMWQQNNRFDFTLMKLITARQCN